MKIVIIGRVIYPLLSPRAFRATELAKEFSRRGHHVTLYGVLGDFDYTEFTKETGVMVRPINMHLATSNSDGNVRYNILDKIAYHLLSGVIEYPDVEFCWKIPGIIKKEQKLSTVDMLITVAYPHPIHWGASIARCLLKKNFPKIWISDCGDPFMGNKVGKKKKFYFKWVERFWGNQTDYVTIPVVRAKEAYYDNVQDKIRIIPQGFEMHNVETAQYKKNVIPHFAYAGSVYPGLRDPSTFLEYLGSLNTDFVFTVFTSTPEYYEDFKNRLGDKLIINPYVPRDILIKELSTQDFLINLTNPNSVQSPSKLIDYYLSGRPILDISTPFSERESFIKALTFTLDKWHEPVDISQYDIRNVVDSFLKLIP